MRCSVLLGMKVVVDSNQIQPKHAAFFNSASNTTSGYISCSLASLFRRPGQLDPFVVYDNLFETSPLTWERYSIGLVIDWPTMEKCGGLVLHNQPIDIEIPGMWMLWVPSFAVPPMLGPLMGVENGFHLSGEVLGFSMASFPSRPPGTLLTLEERPLPFPGFRVADIGVKLASHKVPKRRIRVQSSDAQVKPRTKGQAIEHRTEALKERVIDNAVQNLEWT